MSCEFSDKTQNLRLVIKMLNSVPNICPVLYPLISVVMYLGTNFTSRAQERYVNWAVFLRYVVVSRILGQITHSTRHILALLVGALHILSHVNHIHVWIPWNTGHSLYNKLKLSKSVLSDRTQNGHLYHTNNLVMIKLREVKIWADQVYLGQPVSLHVLLDFFSATSCL